MLLSAYASSEESGETAHMRSLARAFTARIYKAWMEVVNQAEM